MNEIRLERVYDVRREDEDSSAKRADGGKTYRVLVDRMWPRGVKKESLHVDEWCKDIAPSTELREKYHHHDEAFDEFAKEYRAELDKSDAPRELLDRAGTKTIVLLVSSKDPNNNGLVLEKYLREIQK